MSQQVKYLEEKEQLMQAMLQDLSAWDQSAEEAIAILAANNETVEQMRVIDQQLTATEQIAYTKQHHLIWEQIIQKQEMLIRFLQTEKDKTAEQLVQIGQKEKVVASYINLQNNSAFIGKNY